MKCWDELRWAGRGRTLSFLPLPRLSTGRVYGNSWLPIGYKAWSCF